MRVRSKTPSGDLGGIDDYFERIEDSEFLVLKPKPGNDLLIYDPGLPNVATCRSAISYLSGTDGMLRYRDRPIEEVATGSVYLDVALHLLEPSPSEARRAAFVEAAQTSLILHPEVRQVIAAMPAASHPLDIVAAGLLAASGLEASTLGAEPDFFERAAYVIAQTHICAALVNRERQNLDWVDPDDLGTDYMTRVLHRLVGCDVAQGEARAKMLDQILVLHAEHDQNCSTSTVRNVASAGGDLFSATCAGISAFKAPLHGGASEQVPKMLDDIISSGQTPADYVDMKLANKDRLMGFGHRVYDCWDPRARFMYNALDAKPEKFVDVEKLRNTVLELIEATEQRAFFKKRKIYPNPDLFNGILFRWIGMPPAMNGVMLTMSRIAGWTAHYAEQVSDGLPIVRPRQLQKYV